MEILEEGEIYSSLYTKNSSKELQSKIEIMKVYAGREMNTAKLADHSYNNCKDTDSSFRKCDWTVGSIFLMGLVNPSSIKYIL